MTVPLMPYSSELNVELPLLSLNLLIEMKCSMVEFDIEMFEATSKKMAKIKSMQAIAKSSYSKMFLLICGILFQRVIIYFHYAEQ